MCYPCNTSKILNTHARAGVGALGRKWYPSIPASKGEGNEAPFKRIPLSPSHCAFPGNSPNWYLERIEVTDSVTSSTTVFPCSAWLGLDEGDETVRKTGVKALFRRVCQTVFGWYCGLDSRNKESRVEGARQEKGT